MKKINRIWLAAALFLLSAAGLNAQVNPKPFVIPELKTWTGETGQFVPHHVDAHRLSQRLGRT